MMAKAERKSAAAHTAMTLYGFKACSTVRDARAWLAENGIAHTYFDYRSEQLDAKTVGDWIERAGLDAVLSRQSPTFKGLPDAVKASITPSNAKALMIEHTNLIKRPVLDTGDTLVFGFKPESYAKALGK